MKLIDSIIINQLGFHTTTHDRCIYRRVQDGETQLLLCQVDDILLGCENEQSAQNLFNDIKKKIKFPTEVKQGIVPFEFLGIVKDYNGVDITQTKSASHLELEPKIDIVSTSIEHTIHKSNHAQSGARTFLETLKKYENYYEPLIPDISKRNYDSDKFLHNSKTNLQLPVERDSSTERSWTISPLPSDCIN